jgi:argininosuccinate lyase
VVETLRHSTIRKERALERAGNNFSTVTALADVLVQKCGISFSEAHSVVGDMVGEVVEAGSGMSGINASLLSTVSKRLLHRELALSEKEIRQAIDPSENVRSKTSVGGPSPERVEEMIRESKTRLRANSDWLEEETRRVEEAYGKLGEREKRLSAAL